MKIDFPLNTELPLRGGGLAVLWKFDAYKLCWLGVLKDVNKASWDVAEWSDEGRIRHYIGPPYPGLDILPPKRKAWVVWGAHTTEIYSDRKVALNRACEVCGRIQEVAEP